MNQVYRKQELERHKISMRIDEIQIRDPFILKDNHKYFLYGSTDKNIWNGQGIGFDCYIGEDLETWEGPFKAFRPEDGFWGTRNFWAPEVFKYQGQYYMFSSFMSDTHMRGTAILKSEDPRGPFLEWSNGAVTPTDWMCLDGTLYMDKRGIPWMVFCHEWVQIGDGTICAIQLTDDLQQAVGQPIELFKSSTASFSKLVESKSSQISGYVTDGCFLYEMKNGKLLMLWSCMGEQGYCIGYAISETGDLLGNWMQCREPIFKRDGGHGMIFDTYDGRLMLTIHTPNNTPKERAAFFELMEFEDGIKIKANRADAYF